MIKFFNTWLERHIVKNHLVKRKSVNSFFYIFDNTVSDII